MTVCSAGRNSAWMTVCYAGWISIWMTAVWYAGWNSIWMTVCYAGRNSAWMTVCYAGRNSTLHNRQSSIHNDKYQVLHKYSCISWWWAHSRLKHVEKRNKHTKENCALSWLYLQKQMQDTHVVQDTHVELNPGLLWHKQHSTKQDYFHNQIRLKI
jgi:hypothetical protein